VTKIICRSHVTGIRHKPIVRFRLMVDTLVPVPERQAEGDDIGQADESCGTYRQGKRGIA
jgi:hypothetical protein